MCQPGSPWNVIRISVYDSPNFTGENGTRRLAAVLSGPAWLEQTTLDLGEGSALWTAKVDGEFPTDTVDGVVPASAVRRVPPPERPTPATLLPRLGVDVGGSEGGDQTVIRERRGRKAGRVWRMRSGESEKVAAEILARIVESGATVVKIDSIGIGWGVAGHLAAMGDDGRHRAAGRESECGVGPVEPEAVPEAAGRAVVGGRPAACRSGGTGICRGSTIGRRRS